MKIRTILALVAIMVSLNAMSQAFTLTGVVTDSITGDELGYATVAIKGTSLGTTTDEKGNFSITVPHYNSHLTVTYMGYKPIDCEITSATPRHLRLALAPSEYTLKEVVVKKHHEKYSKKNNPAVELIKNMIAHRDAGDPRNHDYLSYNHYERIVVARNDYEPKKKKDKKKSRMDFLAEYVDTLESGATILPISEKRKLETVYYRKAPHSEKNVVRAQSSDGVEEGVLNQKGVEDFLNEVFKPVNIFQNDVPLMLQRFPSPLSTIGPNYYKYYLLDTVVVAHKKCVELGFAPFNSETFAFTGRLYVVLDSTYFIQKATFTVPYKINLNFVSRLHIDQEYDLAPDGTRLIRKNDINVVFNLFKKKNPQGGMYARCLNYYDQYSFDRPDSAHYAVFHHSAPVIELNGFNKRPAAYWTANIPAPVRDKNPDRMSQFMDKLNAVPLYAFLKRLTAAIVTGYLPTSTNPKKSYFDIGPLNSVVNFNTIEGMRYRLGGTSTVNLSDRFFFAGYAAYGTKDGKWKYDGLVEYSFNPRKALRTEFPVHSLRFEYMYDINKLGQQYLYTSKDNIMLAIRRKKDTRATYLRQMELTYTREHYSGFKYALVARHFREYATKYCQFNRYESDGTLLPKRYYDMSQVELKLRYAPKEKFYQMHTERISITQDAWVFSLSHVMSFKHVMGSSYNLQHTEAGVTKRLWFSAFGYMDVILKAGKVWSKVPYPLLIIPNANLTYTIQPESYTNMNAMEFLNDEYVSWDITYYMNGNLLNRIPLIKKLKWREVFCFRGLKGYLTHKNDPRYAGDTEGLYELPGGCYRMGKAPYMEASAGIENIFKFLRIDYVWRLNYRHHAGIQKRGVRMTFHFTF